MLAPGVPCNVLVEPTSTVLAPLVATAGVDLVFGPVVGVDLVFDPVVGVAAPSADCGAGNTPAGLSNEAVPGSPPIFVATTFAPTVKEIDSVLAD